MMINTPPALDRSAFHCPHCQAFAKQDWSNAYIPGGGGMTIQKEVKIAICSHCQEKTLWVSGNMCFPEASVAPFPSNDLPPEIVLDFNEARSIINRSPRGAAALFRLCIQKLCAHLGETGRNINEDIASLVKKGLNPHIQQSLDIVRVIGNEAVHPGQIDLKDDPETAMHLATLINLITEAMITHPKLVSNLYNKLPERKKEEIKKRDGN